MTEIEKIKADLKKLDEFQEIVLRLGFLIPIQFHGVRLDLINRFNEAEKQPEDPWRHAKDTYAQWKGAHHESDHPLEHVAGYICFLEDENKRLVSELESRPVVWTLRSKYTGLLEMSGDYPDIYCLAHAKQFNPNSYSLEPYAPNLRK